MFGPQAGYDMASTTRRIAGLDNRVPHVASKSTQPVGSSLSIRPSAHPRECDRSARSRGQHHRDFGARVSSNDSSAPWTPATVTKGKQAGAIAKGRDRPRGRCRAATAASREQREADPASRFSRRAPEQKRGNRISPHTDRHRSPLRPAPPRIGHPFSRQLRQPLPQLTAPRTHIHAPRSAATRPQRIQDIPRTPATSAFCAAGREIGSERVADCTRNTDASPIAGAS